MESFYFWTLIIAVVFMPIWVLLLGVLWDALASVCHKLLDWCYGRTSKKGGRNGY